MVSALRTWLEQIGLAQYTSQLEEAAIDFDVLPHVSEEHLKQLGLPLGHQIKLLRAAKALAEAPPSPASPPRGAAPVPSSQAERRQLTVMFCDLVGSTALSQSMDPEALRELMRRYQEACRGVVDRYQGYVAQYLGDGMMIYFGWPQAHEDDAERALRSALEIVQVVSKINISNPPGSPSLPSLIPSPSPGGRREAALPSPAGRGTEGEGSFKLQVRIGIATGTVVVGDTAGSDVGAAKLAVGETPNLAARLQAMAKADEIIAGLATHRLVGARFDFEDLGLHTLKGIVEPVHAYRVHGVSRAEGRFEASRTHRLTPIIGRESEIVLLLDRWERAKSGEGQSVNLSAEAGIGKSRVVRALRERIAAEPHEVLNYQCSPYHNNSAFYPVIEQFERAAQFASADVPSQKIAKMESLLAKGRINISEVAPLYAAMLSLPAEGYADLRLSPQQQKERTIAAMADYVIGLAAQRPVLIVLEDVHWADPSSLELFGALLERIESARVLLLITYRPEFSPTWRGQTRVTTLSLARLSRKESAGLAERVSGKALPQEVLEQILVKTDGVPLFVEEFTKAVVESGFMKDAEDRYTVSGPLPPLAIPSTLHDSLMARLDRMATVKDLIQLGAVIGREFSHKLIASLSSMPAPKLEAALDQLVMSELVFKRGTGMDAIYAFKHALMQNAAYESILKSRRQQLHESVATSLEHDVQLAQSNPGFLAQHFDQARLREKAIQWYTEAGHQAKLRSANREALHHFMRALNLLESTSNDDSHLEARIDLHTELGLIHMALDGWASERAMAYFAETEKISQDNRQANRRFRALVGMIMTFSWRARHAEARSFLGELSKLADQSGDRVHRLFAYQVSGQSLMYEGKFTDGLVQSKRAIDLYEERADAHLSFQYGYDPGIVAVAWSGYMQWLLGAYDSAVMSLERCLDLSRRLGHPYSLASALFWLVDVLYMTGCSERIQDYAQEGIDFSERHGFPIPHAMLSFHQGWALGQQGHFDIALEQMTRALEQFKSLGVAILAPRMTGQLASVYGQAGRAGEGLRILQASPDRQPGRKRVRYAETSRIEGDLHLNKSNSDPTLAEQFFREAIEISIEDESRSQQLRATTSLAKLWQSQGKAAEAKALLQPLYDSFTEGFGFPDMKNAKAVLESL